MNTPLINYQWAGVNAQGEKTKGIIQASHIILAKNNLLSQGIFVKKITPHKKRILEYLTPSISQGDIAVWSRQMATLISAGVPLVQSCDIIAKTHGKPHIARLTNQIKHDIEIGTTFTESLQKHPTVFNDLFCKLINVGEKSGCLDRILDQLANYKEKIEHLKKKIKKALSYPLFVIIVSLLVTSALLILVIPQFQALFNSFGAELPLMTRAIIALSQFIQIHWAGIFMWLAAIPCLVIYAKNYFPPLASAMDRGLLQFPVLGAILKKSAIARFSRTLAITFAAGLPLTEALKAVAAATGNRIFMQASQKIYEAVLTGNPLNQAIQNSHLFPNRVVQMIAIGEESGKLEHMLTKLADFYEHEVEVTVDILSSLLEPIIMVILGILVGGLVIAMYLPIFKLGSVV